MIDSCARFLHRANAPSDILSIKLSREYLRLLFPGLTRFVVKLYVWQRPHFRRVANATPLGDSTVSPLDEMPSFHSRTGCPLQVSPAASPLALHGPTLSKQCFRFTLHLIPRRSRLVFRPRCLSGLHHTESPAKNSSTNYFHRTSR